MVNLEQNRESINSVDLVKELSDLKGEIVGGEKGSYERTPGIPPKKKLQIFMSPLAMDSTRVDDSEMEGYHFETVNRGRNVKPHPKMVVEEIKTLRKDIQKIINSFLKKNPADVLGLQKYLNKCLYAVENNPNWAASNVPMVDLWDLDDCLRGTEMWIDTKNHEKIKEDGLLGPQTFAVICCFGKYCRAG